MFPLTFRMTHFKNEKLSRYVTRGPGPFLACREIRVAIPKGKLAQICIIRAAVVPLSYISNTYSCYLNHDLGGGLGCRKEARPTYVEMIF